ncbi:MAG TPA: DUF2269 family protein [Solirubrobacterales bacterium]|nr:DUF2269 family protein [Solirubrobacterales bacterium]
MSLPFAGYYDTGYKIGLFLHVLFVVLAFGPTFGYGILFGVLPQYPQAAPAILAGIQRVDRYLVNPGSIIVLIAGIYLLAASDSVWDGSDAFIVVGFIAILALLGLQHAYFQPHVRKLKELAERDLKSGDTLSPEFQAIGKQVGNVGMIAGLTVVVTIFFMTYKPFM